MEKPSLSEKREVLTTRIFWTAFQTIFIFAVPAGVGAYVGKQLDGFYQTGYRFTIALLIFTFTLSWAIVIMLYRRLNKQIKELENKK